MKFSTIHLGPPMDKQSYQLLYDYEEKAKAIQDKKHAVKKDLGKCKAKWAILNAYK